MAVSLEAQIRIAELRQKAASGDLTLDECKEAISFLRQERLAMPQSTSKPRTAKAVISADDLLKDLGI
jgi:hypothetical protein